MTNMSTSSSFFYQLIWHLIRPKIQASSIKYQVSSIKSIKYHRVKRRTYEYSDVFADSSRHLFELWIVRDEVFDVGDALDALKFLKRFILNFCCRQSLERDCLKASGMKLEK